jgi:hypothetical protein
MRSAPTLNSWMMPCSSVAMIEKLALVRMAFCSAPVLRGLGGGRVYELRQQGRAEEVTLGIGHRHQEGLHENRAAAMLGAGAFGGNLKPAARAQQAQTQPGQVGRAGPLEH